MQKMNFHEDFISWISMLHYQASTRLILLELSDPILLLFSIRQGDPLAMLLYILYIEPLLLILEAKMTGLRLKHISQKIEAFCDDVNLLTSDLKDFQIIEDIISKFEVSSGALLSRNKKCTVFGMGGWKGKENWPTVWMKPVTEVKVFGILFCNSYNNMLRLNWEHRYKNFNAAIHSWSHRVLDTLSQRIEVIRMFALSRVYYVAAILPMTNVMVKRLEKLMGKFIWNFSGKILRVSIDDLKHYKLSGGMQLPCVARMANALLVSQCVRALKSGDIRCTGHLEYWLGDLIGSVFPGLSMGTYAEDTPAYFEHLGLLLAELMVNDTICSSTISKISNKSIYSEFMTDLLPPRVVRDSARDYRHVWKRLHSSVVDGKSRDVMFLLLHNKLPVPERLFRISLLNDPYCKKCEGAEISDIEHYFCHCISVAELWLWLRSKVVNMDTSLTSVTDGDLLNLSFNRTSYEKEVTWLVSSFVGFVWDRVHAHESSITLNTFFGFLSFKYREFKESSSTPLRSLEELYE